MDESQAIISPRIPEAHRRGQHRLRRPDCSFPAAFWAAKTRRRQASRFSSASSASAAGRRQLIDQVPAGGRIVALADCYLQRATDAANERKAKWAVYQDYRQMFDSEKLDAVIIATPDHARTLPCIRAVQAGLDVYAEKPLTAYVREGRVLVDAVRKHNRIFQVGTQQRTMEINRFCCEFVRDGKIGKVKRCPASTTPARAATKACRRSRFPPATIGTPGAARPSCGRSTTSCNSAGCSGATTPAAR